MFRWNRFNFAKYLLVQVSHLKKKNNTKLKHHQGHTYFWDLEIDLTIIYILVRKKYIFLKKTF